MCHMVTPYIPQAVTSGDTSLSSCGTRPICFWLTLGILGINVEHDTPVPDTREQAWGPVLLRAAMPRRSSVGAVKRCSGALRALCSLHWRPLAARSTAGKEGRDCGWGWPQCTPVVTPTGRFTVLE